MSLPERIRKSELSFLKWVNAKKTGRTVTDAVAKYGVTRQGAYQRFERACRRGYLDYEYERVKGGKPQVRYFITEKGVKIVKVIKWEQARSNRTGKPVKTYLARA